MTYVTLRWAFRRMLQHRIRNKGEGGAWRYGGWGGAWAWKPLAGKPLSPIPERIGVGDLTQAKVFSGPGGSLDAELPLGAVVPPLGGTGVGEAAALRAQVGVHPPLGIHFGGGVYDLGQEASYEGAVEGLTITRPIKPLAQASPATSSTIGPSGAPPGAPPSATTNVRTALGAMGTIGPTPDFEVCAFIIRS